MTSFVSCGSWDVLHFLFHSTHLFLLTLLFNIQIAQTKSSLKHDEVVIARRAIEEGRGLVVIVNKMDLLRGSSLFEKVIDAVPKEIQTVIPQVCVLFS